VMWKSDPGVPGIPWPKSGKVCYTYNDSCIIESSRKVRWTQKNSQPWKPWLVKGGTVGGDPMLSEIMSAQAQHTWSYDKSWMLILFSHFLPSLVRDTGTWGNSVRLDLWFHFWTVPQSEWSVCSLTHKHLVSLQTGHKRVLRPQFRLN
jgi:hypothetical protein